MSDEALILMSPSKSLQKPKPIDFKTERDDLASPAVGLTSGKVSPQFYLDVLVSENVFNFG